MVQDSRFDFNDGDFTVSAQIKLSRADLGETSGATPSVVASKPGSWSLKVDPGGRLNLEVFDENGMASNLLGRSQLRPEEWHRVAFTVYGFKIDNSIVRLYLEHELEAESRAVAAVNSNDHEIILGNDAHHAAPFLGSIRGLRFWVSCLAPQELQAVAADDFLAGNGAHAASQSSQHP